MNARRITALALAGLAAVAYTTPLSADDAPAPTVQARPSTMVHAKALDRAWQEGSKDEFRRLASSAPEVDPFLVLLWLLRLSTDRASPMSANDRSMLVAYGAPDAARTLAPGIGTAVDAWLAAPADAVAAELEVSTSRERARRPGVPDGDAGLLARLTAIGDPSMTSPRSIIGPVIRHQVASLLRRSGKNDEAYALAMRVREECRTRAWPMLEAMALDVAGDVLHACARYEDALAVRRDEAALRLRCGARTDYGNAERWRSAAALYTGRIDEAADAARTSAGVYKAAGRPETALEESIRIGVCEIYEGHLDAAESQIREVRDEAARKSFTLVELLADAQLASVLWRHHRPGEALAICDAAIPRAQAGGFTAPLRQLHTEAATALTGLRLFDAAVVHVEAQLALAPKNGGATWRAIALQGMARIDISRRSYGDARARLEESVKLLETTGETLRLARAEVELSRCCIKQNDPAAALDFAERAVARTSGAACAVSIRARALASRGEARLAGGDTGLAVRDMERAVDLSSTTESADSGAHRYLREMLGRCLVAAGRPADGLPHLRAAGEFLLTESTGLADAESLGLRGDLRELAERGTFAASRLAVAEPARAAEAAAASWWFEEAARARTLGEALAGCGPRRGGAIPPELLAAEREALAGIVSARRGCVDAASMPNPQNATAAARVALDAAYRRLRESDVRIARTGATAPASTPVPISLADAQRRVGRDAALITYSLAGERAFALAVTGADAVLKDIGPSAALRETVQAWVELASTPDGPEQALAERLYTALLAPVEKQLVGCTRLYVVPDDVLACVPFDALLRRSEGRAERVIERFEVVCLPSATVFDLLAREAAARPAARGVVALGDPAYPEGNGRAPSGAPAIAMVGVMRSPVGALQPLPRSGDEARAVAALYPEAERTLLLREHATVREFLDAAGSPEAPRRVLHVACHAIVDGEYPSLSGLVLAGGEVLDVEILARTRLAADLAVLSACETAGGKHERGEGMIGLTRGFLIAGVPRVVASSWRVADDATAGLMRAFHERLRRGEPPATALRAVKLARLKEGGASAHPYCWAPFMLWGLP